MDLWPDARYVLVGHEAAPSYPASIQDATPIQHREFVGVRGRSPSSPDCLRTQYPLPNCPFLLV